MKILDFSKNSLKNINKNFFSFFSIFSSQTIIQILFPPAMIFVWGVKNFGIWILIISVFSMLKILNVNFSAASRSEMSINLEKKNFNYINKIFQNTFCLILLNTLFFLIIWLIIISFDQINLKTLDQIESQDVKIIFILIALSAHCSIFDQIFYCGIAYSGDASKYNYNILFFDTLLKILIPLLGLFSENLIYASLILFFISFCKTMFLYIIFKKQNKNRLNFKTNLFDKKVSIKIFRLSLSYQLDEISHIVRNSGIIILIGTFFSPTTVGLISTARTLFYFLPIRFLDIINSTLFLQFSKLFGKRDIISLKKFIKLHLILNILSLTIFCFVSVIFGKNIYEFWTNYKYGLSINLLILILIDAVMFNFFNSAETFIKSINKFFFSAAIKAILSISTIIISYFLFAKGSSILIFFIINIISSILILIFISFASFNILKKYRK